MNHLHRIDESAFPCTSCVSGTCIAPQACFRAEPTPKVDRRFGLLDLALAIVVVVLLAVIFFAASGSAALAVIYSY